MLSRFVLFLQQCWLRCQLLLGRSHVGKRLLRLSRTKAGVLVLLLCLAFFAWLPSPLLWQQESAQATAERESGAANGAGPAGYSPSDFQGDNLDLLHRWTKNANLLLRVLGLRPRRAPEPINITELELAGTFDYDRLQLQDEFLPFEVEYRGAPQKPLLSCDMEGELENEAEAVAVRSFCELGFGKLVEFFPDSRFHTNERRWRDEGGWIGEAFVSYMAIYHPNSSVVGLQSDLLVQSVHWFSSRPIVVVNFGTVIPQKWTAERYPNLLLFHARPIKEYKFFNLNKLRAMMFARVHVGIVVDADQFLNVGCDSMFARTAAEITAEYPFPILPVHWMTRDPDNNARDGYKAYSFDFVDEKSAPQRTMRWGHAHPTFTHHSLPFLAKWTLFLLAPKEAHSPEWLQHQNLNEDEDLLNVGLWSEGATKQWCKFDIPYPYDFKIYRRQLTLAKPLYQDRKWYPKGIPLAFFTAHAAKNPPESLRWLVFLAAGTGGRRLIYYDGQWFESGADLAQYDPSLRCML